MRHALPVLALGLLLLTPLAVADHVFSHRYFVLGRVVDVNGVGIEGTPVQVEFTGIEPEGNCANQPGMSTDAFGPMSTMPVTNAHGDFVFCFHLHAIDRSSKGTFTIIAEDRSVEVPVDAVHRVNHVIIPTTLERDAARPASYLVLGRAFQPTTSEIVVEGVRVHGTAFADVPVEVKLAEIPAITTRTNNYGDFAIRIPLEGAAPSGEIAVTVANFTTRAPIDGPLRVTYVHADVPAPTPTSPPPPSEPAPTAPTSLPPAAGAVETPPTVATPLAAWAPLAALGLAFLYRASRPK